MKKSKGALRLRSGQAEEQGSKEAFASAQSGANHLRPTTDVTCAFCGGRGQDPFGIMSPLATCQVCGGTGRRSLHPPTAPCAFCRGTGVHPFSRLTCTTCGGVGTVEIPSDAVPCLCCGGTGRAADYANYIWPDSPLSCPCCGGKGVVAK
jgi:DnaJ-class molecular chaperone